jgi:hypothetical protein
MGGSTAAKERLVLVHLHAVHSAVIGNSLTVTSFCGSKKDVNGLFTAHR